MTVQDFIVTFKEKSKYEGKYCIIKAKDLIDAKARAQKEFPGEWNQVHQDESVIKLGDLKEVKISPVEVSYEGWNPSEVSSTKQGGAHHTKIRSRDKED